MWKNTKGGMQLYTYAVTTPIQFTHTFQLHPFNYNGGYHRLCSPVGSLICSPVNLALALLEPFSLQLDLFYLTCPGSMNQSIAIKLFWKGQKSSNAIMGINRVRARCWKSKWQYKKSILFQEDSWYCESDGNSGLYTENSPLKIYATL